MRIIFLAPHLRVSGGVRILLTYASMLAGRDHEVTVYVLSNNPIRRFVANIFQIGLPRWIPDFRAHVIRVPAMTVAHIPPADVVVATTWQTALTLATFPASHGRQYYLVQHDEGLYHGNREEVNRALRLPQKKIVVSTWLKEVLKDSHQQDASVLINPVDTNLFHTMPRTAPMDTVRILLLHHTYLWKGTAEGAALIEEMKERHPEIRFILFGVRSKDDISYAYDEYYYDLPQEELASLYSNVDIYLCPSWEEGFGLPSVEAMHCGATLVTYNNGGSRDYAIDGETAFVAPHRDKEALAAKLETAITNIALRKRIAEQGKNFVQNMPTWDKQTKKLERILAGTIY